jgi:PAS domain S-box-containing protein
MCTDDLRVFYVNPAGMRLVGLDDLKAACQATSKDFFSPEDWPLIKKEILPKAYREGHMKGEIRFKHFKTGEPIWTFYNAFQIFDARGIHVGWAGIGVDLTERMRAEDALRESRQELRALTKRLINAQEDEGRRISRQLHDDFSQRLALLALDTGGLLAIPSSEDEIREQLSNLRRRIVELSQDVRGIAHQLHPSILEDLGLAAALRQVCEEFSERERIDATLEQETMPESLPKHVASCLYWIAREALHNISKYAHASRVRLLLSGSPEGIQACIQDDGVGFDPKAGRRHGLGIVSMKERVRMVQGEFSIHSQPGQGTEVRVFVPLPRESLCPP